jgi:NAD+ diphosphatase
MQEISMKYCPLCANTLSPTKREGKIHLACPDDSCDFVHWNNPVPVVAAIIELNNEVLLVHNISWPENMLGLVSGFLDEKEAPDQAVQREIKEELNLDTLDVKLIGVYPFEQMNQVIIAYHATCKGEITLNEELDGYKLLAKSKIKPWNFGTGFAVRDWLKASQ